MTDATEHTKRLQMLLDAATESLLEASDEEILEDIRDTGCDPALIAKEARSAFARALQVRGQRRLQAAREGLQRHRRASTGRERRQPIPADPAIRRKLLDRILARDDLPHTMTMAFREGGKELPDDEVLSALEDLADLGFLDDEIAE